MARGGPAGRREGLDVRGDQTNTRSEERDRYRPLSQTTTSPDSHFPMYLTKGAHLTTVQHSALWSSILHIPLEEQEVHIFH